MTSISGKRVLIFQQRNWAVRIGQFLASRLQQEGAELAAITAKPSTHRFIIEQEEVRYRFVISHDDIMNNPRAYIDRNISLAQICDDLGIDSIWPLMNSMRHHVRSYHLKFYYAYRQSVSDEEIVLYVKAVYCALKKCFDEFSPDLILAVNFVEVPHIMCSMMAKKTGAVMMVPTDSKIQSIKIFTTDYTESTGRFFDTFSAYVNGESAVKHVERARRYIAEFRHSFKQPDYMEKFAEPQSTIKKIRREFTFLRQIWNWYTKPHVNYVPSLGITIDHKPPRIILRDHFAYRRYKRFAERFEYTDLARIGKCIYFPLQFQPEATIDVTSPFYSNQLETARLVAMSLPDDYTLVVKEHPAMVGYRTPSYYEKLAATPNVKLIDYHLKTDEVMRHADLIISPNSTTVAEAAFYNKGAIQFGMLGKTLLLPNVVRHTDLSTLAGKITSVLATDFTTDAYERQLELYVAAAFEAGFDLDYWGLWEQGMPEDMEKLWQLHKEEIEYLFTQR